MILLYYWKRLHAPVPFAYPVHSVVKVFILSTHASKPTSNAAFPTTRHNHGPCVVPSSVVTLLPAFTMSSNCWLCRGLSYSLLHFLHCPPLNRDMHIVGTKKKCLLIEWGHSTSAMGTRFHWPGAVPEQLGTWQPQMANTQHTEEMSPSVYVAASHEFPAALGSALMSKLINYRWDYIGLEKKSHLNTFISQGLA